MRAPVLIACLLWSCAGVEFLPGRSTTPEPSPPEPPPEPAASAAPADAAPPFSPRRVWGEDKAMGTHLAYTAYTTAKVDEPAARRAFEAATAEIRRLEGLMTTWRESEITRVNAQAGVAPVPVSPETYEVVAEAVRAGEMSGGAFDITFESLHGLWKFDEDLDPHPPSDADIKRLLPLLDYRRVKLDAPRRTVFIEKKGVRIGLGGIAKGYAVDRAAAVLKQAGLTSFYVQAGGDLYTSGTKPDGSAWVAGIRDPRDPEKGYFGMLDVSDHAFSTAGDYERSYIVGGKRYHHIIDPRTGYPATECRSVTIWAKTALLADEIDDAVFVLGPEKGLALVESLDDVGAIIIDAKNNLVVSKRLHGKLKIERVWTDGI